MIASATATFIPATSCSAETDRRSSTGPTPTRGDPAADLARTRLLLRQGAVPEHMPALIRRMQAFGRGGFFRLYLRAYARERPIDDDLVDRWEVVRVADRVMEGIDAEQPVLLAQLERFANESA